MNSIEKLFFWTDDFNSSLTYIKWDEDSADINKMITVDDESVLSITKHGIITGQQSTLLNHHLHDIERLPVFSNSSTQHNNFDDIDKLGLLICALIKRITSEVKEQFGTQINNEIELIVLDFYQFFQFREVRTTNALRQYTQQPIRLVNAPDLLNLALKKNTMGPIDCFVIVGVGPNNQLDNSVYRNIYYLNFKCIFDSIKDQITHTGQFEQIAQYVISRIFSKLMSISDSDWVESTFDSLDGGTEQHLLIDKLYLDSHAEALCLALLEKINTKGKFTICLTGLFSDYVYPFFKLDDTIHVKKLNRQSFIKNLVSTDLLSGLPENNSTSIDIIIDGEHTASLDINNTTNSKEILHTLRLFGQDKDNIKIELNDTHGKFIHWNIAISTQTSLDIYDVPIHIFTDESLNLNCEISSTDEIYITSKELVIYDNDRIRPVDAINNLILID